MTRSAVLAAATLAVLVAAALAWSTTCSPQHSYATTMCVAHGAAPTKTRGSERLLAAVVRSLSADERSSLEEALTLSLTRWEARANPLLEDIEDVDPDVSLTDWIQKAPASARIARTATRRRICALDGFCVHAVLAPSCPSGWAPPKSEAEEGRARFISWPWGHAMRFRARNVDEARRAAALLRDRGRSSKHIGLVLAPDDTDVTRAPPFARLRELWKRQVVLAAIARQQGNVTASSRHDEDADLAITDVRDVVVLPRLESIDKDAAFEADVLATAPGLKLVRQ